MLTLHNSVAPVPRSVHRNATTSESHNRLFRLNLWQRLVRHGDIRLVGLMVLSRFSPRLSVVVVTRLRWLFGDLTILVRSAVYVGPTNLTCNRRIRCLGRPPFAAMFHLVLWRDRGT